MRGKIAESKSRVFYKLYIVNIIITVLFICMISMVCSIYSTKLILNSMVTFNENILEEKCQSMDERIRQLDETVYLILGDKNVFNLIMTSEADYGRPMVLLNIIRHFQNICYNNSLVEGIKLIDLQRKIAITEKSKMVIDNDEFNMEFPGASFFAQKEYDGEKKLEWIRRLEPIQGEKQIYIVLTIDDSAFINNLFVGNEIEMMRSCIMTEDDGILIGNGEDRLLSLAEENLKKQNSGTEKMERENHQLLLYKKQSRISNLELGAVQDYTYLLTEAGRVKRKIIIVSLLVIATASVIIYIFSLHFYRPLKQLGSKLADLVSDNEPATVKNEYVLIEHVFDEMQSEKEYGIPSIVRDSVRKLVLEVFDLERFEYLKRVLHQKMTFSWYILMVAECDNDNDRLRVQSLYQDMIDQNDFIDGFIAGITQSRFVGIFNTNLKYDEFLNVVAQRKEEFMTCCVSRPFMNLENMSLIYSEMLRTLEKTFFKGKHTLIYEMTSTAEYKSDFYKKETESQLIRLVTEGKEEDALGFLHDLTKDMSMRATDIQYTRFLYFQICANLIRNVVELGGVVSKEYNEHEIFEEIFSAENLMELEQISERILLVCVKNFDRKENSYSLNVERAIAFMKLNYKKDLSLDDVSGSVFLSSGYLSIIFKEETGCTVLEYLTYIRMQRARELILQIPALKVKDIAEQLGYNNVQSFIRYFKKYYGETPMSFRKKEM